MDGKQLEKAFNTTLECAIDHLDVNSVKDKKVHNVKTQIGELLL